MPNSDLATAPEESWDLQNIISNNGLY